MLFQQGRYWEREATSVQISSTVTIWSKALNQQKEFLVAKYTDVISNFTCRLYAYNFIDTKNIVNSIKHISYKSIIHSSTQKLANPNLIQNIPNQPSKRSTPAIIWSLHLGVMHHRSIVNWIDQSLFNMCPQSLSNGSLMKNTPGGKTNSNTIIQTPCNQLRNTKFLPTICTYCTFIINDNHDHCHRHEHCKDWNSWFGVKFLIHYT